jgi:hypothetical protein
MNVLDRIISLKRLHLSVGYCLSDYPSLQELVLIQKDVSQNIVFGHGFVFGNEIEQLLFYWRYKDASKITRWVDT